MSYSFPLTEPVLAILFPLLYDLPVGANAIRPELVAFVYKVYQVCILHLLLAIVVVKWSRCCPDYLVLLWFDMGKGDLETL